MEACVYVKEHDCCPVVLKKILLYISLTIMVATTLQPGWWLGYSSVGEQVGGEAEPETFTGMTV